MSSKGIQCRSPWRSPFGGDRIVAHAGVVALMKDPDGAARMGWRSCAEVHRDGGDLGMIVRDLVVAQLRQNTASTPAIVRKIHSLFFMIPP